MSARSKLRTIASSSPSGRSPSSGAAGSASDGGAGGGFAGVAGFVGAGTAGVGGAGAAGLGWAYTAPGAPSASASKPIEIDRPFTSSSSSRLRQLEAPGYRLRPLLLPAGSLVVLPQLLELL